MEIDESYKALLVSACPDHIVLVGCDVAGNWVQLHKNLKLLGKDDDDLT